MSLWLLTVFAIAATTLCNAQNLYWNGWHGQDPAWQWSGSHTESEYWVEQAQDALLNLQNSYWNGTNWPSIVSWAPWIGGLINTITASGLRTFTEAAVLTGELETKKFYSQVESYYAGEDAIKLFGQAYDDAQWVVLEWLEAVKFITEYNLRFPKSGIGQEDIPKYAHRAHVFYNVVQDKFDTTLCEGGITWNPALSVYKNAITNELFVTSSIAMYLWFPGDDNSDPYPDPRYDHTNESLVLPPMSPLRPHDPLLLDNAVKGWHWMKSHNFTNAQGLIVDGFHISENQTTCDLRDEMVYTYNQGVILDGLRGLWEATGQTAYLQDAYDLIETVINATAWNSRGYGEAGQWAGLGRNGILEDHCDAPANCTEDQQIFKGAYFQHLMLFCEDLPTTKPLVEGISKVATSDLALSHKARCDSYAEWVHHNALAALSTRDGFGLFGQWWGASYVNKTQAPAPEYVAPIPYGSADICNQPWLLNEPPWTCDGRYGCTNHTYQGPPTARPGIRGHLRARQYPDPLRTVETQVQGFSILRAAIERALASEKS